MVGGVFREDLKPLAPFALRGVLWYQGESDTSRAFLYPELLTAMIGDWRSILEIPKLPFLVVQLPPWERRRTDPPRTTVGYHWADLREAQDRVVREVPATYLASTADLGERLDIHPRRKREVGERLATLARASVYGEPISASGPRVEIITSSPHSTLLTFANVEGGLLARGEELHDFEVAGSDDKFLPVTATIISHYQLVVRHPNIKNVTTLRYAWRDYYIPTLFNGDGWPASPFRIIVTSPPLDVY
jgi:sialate O-acetylesterase